MFTNCYIYYISIYFCNQKKKIKLYNFFNKYTKTNKQSIKNNYKYTLLQSILSILPFLKRSKKLTAIENNIKSNLEHQWYELVKIDKSTSLFIKQWEWPTKENLETIKQEIERDHKNITNKAKIYIGEQLKNILIWALTIWLWALIVSVLFRFIDRINPTCWIDNTQYIINAWWQWIINQYQRVLEYENIINLLLAFFGTYMLIFILLSWFIRMISFGNKWFLFVSKLLFWCSIIILLVGFCLDMLLRNC